MDEYSVHVVPITDPTTGVPILLRLNLPGFMSERLPLFLIRSSVEEFRDLPLLLCLPIDRRFLAPDVARDIWPSVDHREDNCFFCTGSIWLGPQQENIAGLPSCVYCVHLREMLFDAAEGAGMMTSRTQVMHVREYQNAYPGTAR